MSSPAVPRHLLPMQVFAQFAGTSLGFAVNAVTPDLQRELDWPATAVGTLTSALQAASSSALWCSRCWRLPAASWRSGVLLVVALSEAPHAAVARVSTLQWRALATIGTDAKVRSSVLAYLGHMWGSTPCGCSCR